MLALVSLLLLQQAATFEGPADANPEALTAAAKSLAARAEAFGYKGVTATVRDGKIVVTSDAFTEEMGWNVSRLAGIPGKRVEIRTLYVMSQAEQEQFKPGTTRDTIVEAKAPTGARWFVQLNEFPDRPRDFDSSLKFAFGTVLWNDPAVPFSSAKRVQEEGATSNWYELAFPAAKKLYDRRTPQGSCQVCFVVDEFIFMKGSLSLSDKADSKKGIRILMEHSRYFEPIIRNPMPFGLKLVK